MAGHWATEAVISCRYSAKRGLAEHAVFDLFYNYPLSLRRRIRERDENLSTSRPRMGRSLVLTAGGSNRLFNLGYFKWSGRLPAFAGLVLSYGAFPGAPLAAGLSAFTSCRGGFRSARWPERSWGGLFGLSLGLELYSQSFPTGRRPEEGLPPAGWPSDRSSIVLFAISAVLECWSSRTSAGAKKSSRPAGEGSSGTPI